MNILDVMTKENLMKPPDIRDGRNYGGYNLTAYFIRVHGRAMGGFSKPMIFDRNRVEAYLDGFFGQAERDRSAREESGADIKRLLDQAIAQARVASVATIGSGKILGKGGRRPPSPQPSPARGEGAKHRMVAGGVGSERGKGQVA